MIQTKQATSMIFTPVWHCPREGCAKELTKRRDIDQHNAMHRAKDQKSQALQDIMDNSEEDGVGGEGEGGEVRSEE